MTSKPSIEGALAAMCNLGECNRATRAVVVERFIASAIDVLMIPGGVLLQFARTGASARAVLGFIGVERECCARYQYRVHSGKETLDLEITGRGQDVHHLQTFYLGLARRAK
jgi:hypothetical protein